jgi:hypothetical protein
VCALSRRLDGQLARLQEDAGARAAALRAEVAADAAACASRISAEETDLASLHATLGEVERRGAGGAQLASRVGPRVQAAEAARRGALEAAAALEHLWAFSVAEDPSSLPDLFHKETRMTEASVRARLDRRRPA